MEKDANCFLWGSGTSLSLFNCFTNDQEDGEESTLAASADDTELKGALRGLDQNPKLS